MPKYYAEFYFFLFDFQVHMVPLISSSGDEFMSCDRYFESRRESRVLEKIPCDMSKVTYCKHKGPSYPE